MVATLSGKDGYKFGATTAFCFQTVMLNFTGHVLFALLSSFLLLVPRANGKTVPPPSVVSLIGPAATSNLLFNSSVILGFAYPDDGPEFGLINIANVNVTHPNGTNHLVIGINDFTPSCSNGKGSYTGSVFADQEGSYTALYNITYGLSSDPTQANATFCGPPPFSFQTWILNRTFTVQAPGTGFSSGAPGPTPSATTVTTDLPSEPTGRINRGFPSVGTEGLGSRVIMLWLSSLVLVMSKWI